MTDTDLKLEHLIRLLKSLDPIAIGFSGGVDSTFLCALAYKENIKVLAITVHTLFQPQEEIQRAQQLASDLAIPHYVEKIDIQQEPFFKKNPENRCYHCKYLLFLTIKKIAADNKIFNVIDGTNADDQALHRPGTKALQDLGIHSPLKDVGLTKQEIRYLSKNMHIATWNRPPESCLATRIAYETSITMDMLKQIEQAESIIKSYNVTLVRIRHQGIAAVIEVLPKDIRTVSKHAQDITKSLNALGFMQVYLNSQGYQSGKPYERNHKKTLTLLPTGEDHA